MRAGRVQNDFDLEQTGAQGTISVQYIPPDGLEEHAPLMAVFVAVKASSVDDFESLAGEDIQRKAEEVMAQYDEMLPPDLTAVALRKLGIKCKTILANPENIGPEGLDPQDYPGFRAVMMHFPGAKRTWVSPK
jgi:hypothetical protein